MRDPEYRHHVRIHWGEGADNIDAWDTIAIWVIENFGLPGKEYITDMSPDWMAWSFRDDRSAFLMRLRFGEVIAREYATND